MAVIQLTEPAADVQQRQIYNENMGGNLNRSVTFSVPAGISWAVVGCVLTDAATPANIESTLIPAVTALAEVVSVNGDQLYGQMPATISAVDHEPVLNVTSTMTTGIGTVGDYFTEQTRCHETIKPPVAKKWVVLVLRVPDPLDNTKIAALEAAIEGIAGVTTCEHLIDGTVSARAVAAATLVIATHVRIEPVEV